ncbi:MAG: hypothetical protein IJ187_06920 [Neisseriaceae bacterium]|nr:hypothetical protein [Neisseriaceae bacterium]
METFVYFVLLLLGIFFIYNGLNSLKKLEENNQKWERLLTRKSEFYLANFLEAQELIKKLKRYISFLARFELLNGILVILFTLLAISGNITSSDLSSVGTFALVLLGIALFVEIVSWSGGDSLQAIWGEIFGTGEAVDIPLTTRYQLLVDFLDKECRDNFCELSDCFDDYLRNKKFPHMGTDDTDYRNNTRFRYIILTCGYSGFLLFIIAFYFDFSFRKMVVDFISIPFV